MFFKKLVLSSTILFTLFTQIIYPKAYQVIPGGESIGIVLNYPGVMITHTYVIEEMDHYDPALHGFKAGDIITHVNDLKVENMDELVKTIEKQLQSNESLILTLNRNQDILKVPLKVYYDEKNQTYSTGLYIKDNITGIGTITYYDPATHTFGALGHSLTDQNGYEFTKIDGQLFQSHVLKIVKSKNGQPGEKIAKLDKTETLGNIDTNNEYGIFGTYFSLLKDQKLVETAPIDEIECGPAYIYTVINGDDVEKFDILITNVKDDELKGISFTITDKELLEKTNGVIQGMSGSPIFQNDKIIGCITHVSKNDVIKGYGLSIEKMIENSK